MKVVFSELEHWKNAKMLFLLLYVNKFIGGNGANFIGPHFRWSIWWTFAHCSVEPIFIFIVHSCKFPSRSGCSRLVVHLLVTFSLPVNLINVLYGTKFLWSSVLIGLFVTLSYIPYDENCTFLPFLFYHSIDWIWWMLAYS